MRLHTERSFLCFTGQQKEIGYVRQFVHSIPISTHSRKMKVRYEL